jgi:CRP/FNR family transcriptional regulator, cyclic AMP receptor protein
MPRKIYATAEQVQDCPIFKTGDKMCVALPEVIGSESDGICAIALSDLLPWAIKMTAGGAGTEQTLLCRGCRGGRAQAGFVLESQGELIRDAKTTRKMQTLKVIPLFGPLPDRQLEKVTERIKDVEFAPGQPIIEAGEVGRALYIVQSGKVEVVKPAESRDKPEMLLGILSAGECFGEMSLLTGDPASATIRAREPVRALSIGKEDFDDLLAKNPVLNSYFSKLLALRLKQTNSAAAKAFIEEMEKGVTGQLSMLAGGELIQAITVTDRTGILAIRAGGSGGPESSQGGGPKKSLDLYFKGGQIHHVENNWGSDNEEAFYDFLLWRQGTFRFTPGERPDLARTFNKDTTGLLLEGMRRLDEKQSPAPA